VDGFERRLMSRPLPRTEPRLLGSSARGLVIMQTRLSRLLIESEIIQNVRFCGWAATDFTNGPISVTITVHL
jgi:hypothetical protein